MAYIARLLVRPGTRVHCDELLVLDEDYRASARRAEVGVDAEPSEHGVDDWSKSDGIHTTDRDYAFELVDESAAAAYERRLKEIERQLSGELTPKSSRSKLEAERKELRRLLGTVGKRKDVISANDKKKMNNVSKAIEDSITAIAKVEDKEQIPATKSLAAHLKQAIAKGMYLVYHPLQDIDWRIETIRR